MSEDRTEKFASGSRSLGMMEGKGSYNKYQKPQHSATEFGHPGSFGASTL
jgi:hypothetical protein